MYCYMLNKVKKKIINMNQTYLNSVSYLPEMH